MWERGELSSHKKTQRKHASKQKKSIRKGCVCTVRFQLGDILKCENYVIVTISGLSRIGVKGRSKIEGFWRRNLSLKVSLEKFYWSFQTDVLGNLNPRLQHQLLPSFPARTRLWTCQPYSCIGKRVSYFFFLSRKLWLLQSIICWNTCQIILPQKLKKKKLLNFSSSASAAISETGHVCTWFWVG